MSRSIVDPSNAFVALVEKKRNPSDEVVTSRGVQTEFLKVGGTPQERYESLRSRWLAADSPGVLGMVRLPWGRRLLYFGVLGVLDTDPTGTGSGTRTFTSDRARW